MPVVNGCTQVIFQDKVALHMQGRVFALKGAIAGAAFPLAYAIAGPLADYVFEPLMAASGPLAGSLGELMGVGPGSGIRLMFIILGALTMTVTFAAYQNSRFCYLEDEVPDATPDETPAGLEAVKS
jgi:DHA3 family macrolide efflux protein-like MFS transporter